MPRRFVCRSVLFVLLLIAVGCTSFCKQVGETPLAQNFHRSLSLDGTEPIRLAVMDPQSSGTAGIKSVAVLDFKGSDKVGEALAATLVARLNTTGRFEVKDPPTVQQVAARKEPRNAAQIGLKLGADAVLTGEVVALEQQDSAAETEAAPALKAVAGSNAEALRKELHTRQGTMTVDFRLLDSKTGKVLLSRRTTSKAMLASLKSLSTVEAEPSAAHAQQQLLDQAADQIVAEMAQSGRRTVERKFARCGGKVNRGNTYTRQGVTDFAQQMYQEAAEENEKNHAAWYNLGLILEADADYATACECFERAMKLRECELYIGAFQRARSAGGSEVTVARVSSPPEEKETKAVKKKKSSP